MGQNTSEGDGGADQGVELLVATDGELQVAWGDALDLEIFGGVLEEGQESRQHEHVVGLLGSHEAAKGGCNGGGLTYACQLKDFGRQVLENGSNVNGSLGADTHLVLGVGLEETLDTTAGELEDDAVSHRDAPG